MREAKKRDGGKCRWPRCEFAAKKLPIDACHLTHRGMGGDKGGTRTMRHQLVSLCRAHHGLFDACEIDVQPLTTEGTDGPVMFSVIDPEWSGAWLHIASESRIGVSEPRR